jgi:GntR family transcriptional repressor for pyruvate dehydrogenase complex
MSLLGESSSGYRPGYELAAERILEMIVEQELRPGERLPTEQELADRFGLSRSVTREAIKILAAIGRVSAQRGRGLYVGAGTSGGQASLLTGHQFIPGRIDHVEQLLEFRLVQESFAAEEAARKATPPDINLLSRALEDCDRALESGDRELWEEADTRFHLGIAKASGNNFIRAALESVRQLQQQVVLLALHGGSGGSLEAAQREHVEILDAIRGGKPDAAADAARRHLRHTIDGYRDEIAEMIAPASQGQ